MLHRLKRHSPAFLLMFLAACGVTQCSKPAPLDDATLDTLYADPVAVPPGAQRIYHLGHSLVGRDMPAMLQQLAGEGHLYESQLGWGSSLKAHWEPGEEINGFEEENAHPRYRDAQEAIDAGDYDAVVLTEMVEIRDAIQYYDSADYLHRWAGAVWESNPEARVYLYETWHNLDDPDGWLARLDNDLSEYWEGEILRVALAYDGIERPIHIIPAGQVMARFVREIEARGGVDGITTAQDLFSDMIHFNDLGAYLVALTHYAVLYQQSPVGLPHELQRADGTPADAPGADAALLMQEIVWEVVRATPRTGL